MGQPARAAAFFSGSGGLAPRRSEAGSCPTRPQKPRKALDALMVRRSYARTHPRRCAGLRPVGGGLVGAANIAKAYGLYAGRVPATSMQMLIYMALVSKDADDQPWFGMGHDALAQLALGREAGRAGVKAVERAIGPLFDEGAITTQRRAAQRSTGPNTVRYRLHLDAPAEPRQQRRNDPRKPGDVTAPAQPLEGQRLPPETVHDVPRFPDTRPPETVLTSPGNRGTEEVRGKRRSELEEKEDALRTDVAVVGPEPAASRSEDLLPQEAPGSPTTQHPPCPTHPIVRGGRRPDGTPECIFCRNIAPLPDSTPEPATGRPAA